MSAIVARNELRRFFLTPLAWVLLAAVIAVLAYFFLVSLGAFFALMPKIAGMADAPGVTDLVVLPLLRAIASLLLVIVPLLGMRAIAVRSAERKSHVTAGFGHRRCADRARKYFGLLGFVIVFIFLAASMPLSLEIGTSLDLGRIAAAVAGLILFAAALCAIAVASSAAHAVLCARGRHRVGREPGAVDARRRRALRRLQHHVRELSRAADASGTVPARHRGECRRCILFAYCTRRADARGAARRRIAHARLSMGERLLDWLFTALLLAAAVMLAFFSTRFGWQHDFSYRATREPRRAHANAARASRCADIDRLVRTAGQSIARRHRGFRRSL